MGQLIQTRVFNETGLTQFAQHIEALRKNKGDTSLPPDYESDDISIPFEPECKIDPEKKFNTLYDFSLYLDSIFPNEIEQKDTINDRLWAWVSCLYFKQLTKEKPRQPEAYIPSTSYGERKKLLLYRNIPLISLRLFRNKRLSEGFAKFFLENIEIDSFGEFAEQIASSQTRALRNKGIQDAILKLYKDNDGKLKIGASSKGPGTIRRFMNPTLARLQMVADIDDYSADDFIEAWGPEIKNSKFFTA